MATVKSAKKNTAPKKRATKKTASVKKAVAKTPAKKTEVATPAGANDELIPLDAFGFREGSDTSIAAHALVEGGADRKEINNLVREKTSDMTRNGTEKNIPSMVSNLISRLLADGYTVESRWALVPPPEVKKELTRRKAAAARAAKRKSKTS